MGTTTLTSPPSLENPPSRSTADEEALCREWLAYVKGIARKFGSDPEIESDALLGLVQAIRTWDSTKAGFKTYLGYRIPGAILDGMRARDYASRSARKKMDEDDVRLKAPTSLDMLREEIGYDAVDDASDVFQELRDEAELRERIDALFTYAAMVLTPREYEVLFSYYREGVKLWKIGEVLEVTESRCSQILKAAEHKLRMNLCPQSEVA